jgi:hypothetical protein
MADTLSEKTSFLRLQAYFMELGLDLVFYGRVAILVATISDIFVM